MKTSAKIYIALVSIAGIALGIGHCYAYFAPWLTEGAFSVPMLAIPVLICALCRSLPIEIRKNEYLDLSVIGVLAVYLTQGVHAAVTCYMLCTFFTFDRSPKDGRMHHIFTIGLEKVFFNDATVILSIIIPAFLIENIFAWTPGALTMPAVLLPTALFSILTFVINGLLQMFMFCLAGMIVPAEMLGMLLGLTPNVCAAMPLGLLMGFGYSSENTIWFVFLMLFPLLLARYAWKLYLLSESNNERMIRAFINSIEAKDKYTQGHSERVAAYAVQIARQMKLPRKQVQLIRQGAVLHDIGKIGIPDSILNKNDRLTDEEFDAIRAHPQIGERILKEVGLAPEVLELVLYHHERLDGRGYPSKRPASELSMACRILCVADAFDAMTSDRPYRKTMDMDRVKEILHECSGTQFDPEVVDALLKTLE